MKNERKFYTCPYCGNIITYIYNAGPTVVCCGEEMKELAPNTADAAQEKHVPVAVREGNKLTVSVGSVAHPMTEAHHIAWVIVAESGRTQRVDLVAAGAPAADFYVGEGPVTVYAYCNLHGLWASEL